MKVRDAVVADAVLIAGFWSPQILTTSITFSAEPKSPPDVAKLIEERPCFLVVELDGAVAGLVTFGQFRGGAGYRHTKELTIILAPHAQGQGAGRALLEAALDRARALDVHVIVAGVSSENKTATAFHKRMGFEQVGMMPQVGRKFGRWMDLILLQKTL